MIKTVKNTKKTQKATRGSNEKEAVTLEQFNFIFKNITDGVTIQNASGKLLYANNAAATASGYTSVEQMLKAPPQEFIKKFSLFDEQDRPVTIADLPGRLALAGKNNPSIVLKFVNKKTGEIRFSKIKSSLLKALDGSTYCVINFIDDITEIKQVQQKLVDLAAIVESSNHAIIGVDLQGNVTNWNNGAEELYGYTSEEIVGKPLSILVPPNRKNDFPGILKQLRKSKKLGHYETQRITKSKKIIDISVTISPIKDNYGNLIGASKIARNITKQKRMEEALRQNENNLQFLSEASKELASSLDYKKTLTTITKLAIPHIADWCTVDIADGHGELQLVALSHKNPKKVSWAKKLRQTRPIDMQAKSGIANVFRTGKSEFIPLITDEMLVHAAKSKKELALTRSLNLTSVIMVPITAKKRVLGAITFITTHTQRQYSKADLLIAEELAHRAGLAIENAQLFLNEQKAVAVRDEFISVASHELKTPITSLKLYVQTLHKDLEGQADNPKEKILLRMNDQIDKLTVLINNLLNVTKIKHGKLDLEKEYVDLNEFVKDTVEAIGSMSLRHKIIIKGKVLKTIYADRYRLYQVLANLLTNAIKYSPQSDRVIVTLASKTNGASISVRDFGVGIDSDEQKKVFDRFYRVSSPLEKTFPGLGMGLYIASEIVKRHGGKLYLTSKKGEGSTFSFTIPYKKEGPPTSKEQ